MALRTREMAGWGLADMGIAMFNVVKQLLVFAFLTTYLGVPPASAGVVTFAVLIFDMVTDPLVGVLSDRVRTRWGRRVPWIAVGAPLLAGGVWAMFSVPGDMAWQGNLAWVVAFFAVATLGFTCVAIPYGAMAGEMTRDARERSSMTAWRMSFASLGLLIAGAVLPAIAGDSRAGYGLAVTLVAPVIVLSIWAMLWLTRRAPRIATPAAVPARDILRALTDNRPFMLLVALYALKTLAVAIISAGLQLAAVALIADDGQGALSGAVAALGTFSTLFAAFVLGAVASQYPWVRASARFGKLATLVASLGLYVVVLVGLYLLLPAASVTPVALLFVIAGVANGAYQQIPWAMYPDLMDVTRTESGLPLEGAFSALWLFGQKVANAIGPLVIGVVLAAAGWQESTGGPVAQSDQALAALRIALTLLPAGLFLLAALCLVTLYRRAVAGSGVHG